MGSYHSCALLGDGSARCWGQNDYGQLGNGSQMNSGAPVGVFSLPPSTAIAAGGRHSCARLADATVQCWGGNDVGELGDGTTDGALVSRAGHRRDGRDRDRGRASITPARCVRAAR